MRTERHFEGSDGVWRVDAGETPLSQIKHLELVTIYDDNDSVITEINPFYEKILRKMGELVEGTKVLEIGYGAGITAQEIRKKGIKHDICDIVSDVLEEAGKTYPHKIKNSEMVVGDYRQALAGNESGSYDCIVVEVGNSNDVVTDAVGRNEVMRLLKKGGKLIHFEDYCWLTEAAVPKLNGFVKESVVEVVYDGSRKDLDDYLRQVLVLNGEYTPQKHTTLVALHRAQNTRRTFLAKYKKL